MGREGLGEKKNKKWGLPGKEEKKEKKKRSGVVVRAKDVFGSLGLGAKMRKRAGNKIPTAKTFLAPESICCWSSSNANTNSFQIFQCFMVNKVPILLFSLA